MNDNIKFDIFSCNEEHINRIAASLPEKYQKRCVDAIIQSQSMHSNEPCIEFANSLDAKTKELFNKLIEIERFESLSVDLQFSSSYNTSSNIGEEATSNSTSSLSAHESINMYSDFTPRDPDVPFPKCVCETILSQDSWKNSVFEPIIDCNGIPNEALFRQMITGKNFEIKVNESQRHSLAKNIMNQNFNTDVWLGSDQREVIASYFKLLDQSHLKNAFVVLLSISGALFIITVVLLVVFYITSLLKTLGGIISVVVCAVFTFLLFFIATWFSHIYNARKNLDSEEHFSLVRPSVRRCLNNRVSDWKKDETYWWVLTERERWDLFNSKEKGNKGTEGSSGKQIISTEGS
ncbi:uncharacterized protein MONOS_18582 [Monocercomonoides exilis]|uniref:uncharacterized protein n=1 Tax=Monocercomonoides exilis TaxID=2049356 RepID=UPI003559F7B9|nr:hypothetical protein MONOS_18582 [Monocercomonoides exilis]